MKVYLKMKKTIIKFGGIWNDNLIFHQYRKPIWMKSIDINKIVVSNQVYFGKIAFKYFIGLNVIKNYAYFFQKRVLIEKALVKLNICLLW